jgi:hypothetical protein
MDMEQQDIPTGRTKRTSQETSRFKKLDKHTRCPRTSAPEKTDQCRRQPRF